MGDVHFVLQTEFGYVVFVLVLMWMVILGLSINVSRARKKYDVQVPNMYSNEHEIFNCIQRAHQNTLEIFPTWAFFLVLGGLQHPIAAAVGGLVVVISRLVFAIAYSTGVPKRREWGEVWWLGLLVNLGCSISFGVHLVADL